MKLEPVAVMDADGDIYKKLPMPNWHPPHTNLYSETQLRAEIEKRDAVLREVLSILGPTAPECCGCAAEWRMAIKAIQEVLG